MFLCNYPSITSVGLAELLKGFACLRDKYCLFKNYVVHVYLQIKSNMR